MIELMEKYVPLVQTPISLGLIWFVWRIKVNCLPTLRRDMQDGFKDVGEQLARLEGRVEEHLESSPGRRR